jgi:hypothetical protein
VSSGSFVVGVGVGLAVGPGGVFVVEGAVGEAPVEDADEAVGEGPEGLVVEVAGGAVLVVEGAASGAVGERAEGGEVESVVEASVADVAGEDGFLFAGRDGQW